jgi:hypothetical protein
MEWKQGVMATKQNQLQQVVSEQGPKVNWKIF